MKRYLNPLATMLVLAAVGVTSFAPAADANHDRRGQRGRDGRAIEVVVRDPHWSRRTYFYRDIDTGRRDSHISNLRPGYGHRVRRARVEKIEIRSGHVIARYVWVGDRWVDSDRDYRVARQDRRGWNRDRGYGVSYRGY